MGKLIMIIGGMLVLGGAVIYLLEDKIRWDWLGNLPGDIRIEKGNFKLYFPLMTSILLTFVVNVLIWIFKKLS
ncbi:DUF2905 domain-containing protein [Flectobacillus roseus]|uniref:DUF2905 domain-containing protein n=1 Tax=Flectobacillus roseus TaxID=502259 RepID=A0ABT6YDC0_9BACT|nr:DUF2905 domain-containing protein [Flectobacillus roseus]MDI9861447.1 DUF2905 domain-containing protein [Flectobacillus roseus]